MPFGNFDEICYFALFRLYVSGGGRLSGRRALQVRKCRGDRNRGEVARGAGVVVAGGGCGIRLEEAHSAGEKGHFAPVVASGWNAAELE